MTPEQPTPSNQADATPTAAATLVVKDGKVLIGNRQDVTCICGPGGHIEDGETPEQAARREAMEEFGIKLGGMLHLGQLDGLPEEYGLPVIYLCTDFEGEPTCDGKEMQTPEFVSLDELQKFVMFPPFKKSINLLMERLGDPNE